MPKINDSHSQEKLKIFIYGESGTGKTYSISTFPSPVYVFDFDRGIQTLAGIVGEDFEYDTYHDPDPRSPKAYLEFRKKVTSLRKNCPYETIVLDSVTALGEKAITNYVRSSSGHLDTPMELQDHLKISDKLGQAFDELLGIPATVVVLSHPKIIQVEETGELKFLVMQTGNKLPQRIPLYFDEVYKADKKPAKGNTPEEYIWQTRSDRKWPARSRFNRKLDGKTTPILDKFETPDLSAILTKVEGCQNSSN